MVSMAKVDCSLEDGHDLDPLRLRNETELGNGRLTNRAAGNIASSDEGLALLEDRIDVLGPDLLHEDGQGSGDPDVHHGEDLEEGIEIGRTCERMISEGSRGRKG